MWRCDKTRVVWENGSFTFEMDVEAPENGLGRVELGGQAWHEANPLQIRARDSNRIGQSRCDNFYLRPPDLVASYHMSNVPEISWQVYWRGLSADDHALGGVELILSVHTDLLDSDPRLTIDTHLQAGELLQIKPDHRQPCVLLFRPAAVAYTYLEMIHPADLTALEVVRKPSTPPALVSRFHLFDEHLEKGVIRRGRLRAMVLARVDDVAAAKACYQSFVESAIPLTT